jgi:hypothetical protein
MGSTGGTMGGGTMAGGTMAGGMRGGGSAPMVNGDGLGNGNNTRDMNSSVVRDCDSILANPTLHPASAVERCYR